MFDTAKQTIANKTTRENPTHVQQKNARVVLLAIFLLLTVLD